MILTENHRIKRNKHKELYKRIDAYCYSAKNLSNSVQYLICQCYRIHQKLKNEKVTEPWEQEMIDNINNAIIAYNAGREKKKELKLIDADNGFIADAYFLSWHIKTQEVYKAMPYATCSQICIQEKCREWKSFYKAKKEYNKDPDKFLGSPRKPGYLDPKKGRGDLVITSQNFSIGENGLITMPGFLKGIKIKARHRPVRQIRIRCERNSIRIMLMYEQETEMPRTGGNIMGIDLGVDNLVTASLSSGSAPVIINGRPLKSINRYYNKRKACMQEVAKRSNRQDITNRMERLTAKRNNKVKDYLHKASRRIIEIAKTNGVSHIVIGNNRRWKQKVELGKRINQTFVSIPYRMLIDMICYKAEMVGIRVSVVKESYTSGTSYLDGEMPDKASYNISRRIKRGIFKSNKGTLINADVNAAYQIIKTGGYIDFPIKEKEKVIRLNVA
jgi:putative transposase